MKVGAAAKADIRPVLCQFVEAVKSEGGRRAGRESVRSELERVRAAWLSEWAPILGSSDVPMTPYRVEIPHLVVSHDKYGTRERPEDIAAAFARARKATEGGQAALLEFITSQATRFSHRGALR